MVQIREKISRIFQEIFNPLNRIFLRNIKKMQTSAMLNAFHDAFFKFPAGHLSGFKAAGEFITAHFGRSANQISNLKSIGNWNAATMKNGMGSS